MFIFCGNCGNAYDVNDISSEEAVRIGNGVCPNCNKEGLNPEGNVDWGALAKAILQVIENDRKKVN